MVATRPSSLSPAPAATRGRFSPLLFPCTATLSSAQPNPTPPLPLGESPTSMERGGQSDPRHSNAPRAHPSSVVPPACPIFPFSSPDPLLSASNALSRCVGRRGPICHARAVRMGNHHLLLIFRRGRGRFRSSKPLIP